MWYLRRVLQTRRVVSPHSNGRAALAAVPEPFAVEVQHDDDVAVVRPRGELDLATVETLQRVLDGISSPRLVLDLSELCFIDSTGLHLLVALHERAQREEFELLLRAPRPPVDRTMHLCGLAEALPFTSALDVAV